MFVKGVRTGYRGNNPREVNSKSVKRNVGETTISLKYFLRVLFNWPIWEYPG